MIYYNAIKKNEYPFFTLEKWIKKDFTSAGGEEEWRRGKRDELWVLWMTQNSNFWQHLPLFFLQPAKTQQAKAYENVRNVSQNTKIYKF